MKRVIVLMGAAVLLHSVASMAAIKRDFSVTGEGTWWRELMAKGAGETAAPQSPPGPHMILTVPVSLKDVPAGVDAYKITCVVARLPDEALQNLIAKDRKLSQEFGAGVATGNLSASTGNPKSVSVEAKVGIFLAPVGEEIEIRDDPRAKEWRRVKAVDAPDVYQCILYLFGESWGQSVPYLDPDATLIGDSARAKDPLPYQKGESAFPILAGAKYQRVVTGRFLPAK